MEARYQGISTIMQYHHSNVASQRAGHVYKIFSSPRQMKLAGKYVNKVTCMSQKFQNAEAPIRALM
jgi:hypothetical protein